MQQQQQQKTENKQMIIAINRASNLQKKIKTHKNKTLKQIWIFNGRTLTKLVSVIIMIFTSNFSKEKGK